MLESAPHYTTLGLARLNEMQTAAAACRFEDAVLNDEQLRAIAVLTPEVLRDTRFEELAERLRKLRPLRAYPSRDAGDLDGGCGG